MKLLVSILAFFSFLIPVVALDAAPVAHAQVTNCITIYASNWYTATGKCTSTNPNYPYTTQFQVWAPCADGLWVHSAWYGVSTVLRSVSCYSHGGLALSWGNPFYSFR